MPALEEDNSTSSKAVLRTISCSELQDGAPYALKDLFLAATEDGIFYLNFEDDKRSLDQSIQDVDRLNRALFDLPIEEKLRFDIDFMGKLKLNGYKPIGRNKGGIKGHRDGFESYAISQDTIKASSSPTVRHPSVVAEYGEALNQLTSSCLAMTQLILSALSRAFSLPADCSFESRHDSVTSPLDLVRLLRYPNALGDGVFSIPQLAHADMGSLTFLFASSPGLQILPADTAQWLHVLPRPGHAIVNFGDALKMLSGGRVESVLHRVVTMPGAQVRDRYSFAFLVRPQPKARMTALPGLGGEGDGLDMTCEDWVAMRFGQLRAK